MRLGGGDGLACALVGAGKLEVYGAVAVVFGGGLKVGYGFFGLAGFKVSAAEGGLGFWTVLDVG